MLFYSRHTPRPLTVISLSQRQTSLIPSIGVLPFGGDMLNYMLDAYLFLQRQSTLQTKTHIVLCF